MSASDVPPDDYGSLADFYPDVYGHALRGLRPAGRNGAVMLDATQGAGDWSDAPVPDLILSMAHSEHCAASVDLGAGRFTRRARFSGDLILIPPNSPTSIQVGGEHRVRALAIPYQALAKLMRDDADLLPEGGDFGHLHAGWIDDPLTKRLLTDLWVEVEQNSPHAALFADGVLIQIAARLLHLQATGLPRPLGRATGGLTPRQERQAIEFLSNHLAEEVSLDMLAETARLSTWHFARAFKASTGLPPHAYMRKLRCERAAELLTKSGVSVGKIAAAVGYETPQAFARMFRAEVGASPSEYRRERRS